MSCLSSRLPMALVLSMVLIAIALVPLIDAQSSCSIPLSTNTGGGYVPMFGTTLRRFYVVKHRTQAQVICVDPVAGADCGGGLLIEHPAVSQLYTSFLTPFDFEGQVVIDNRLYFTVTGVAASSWSFGVGCYDMGLNDFCSVPYASVGSINFDIGTGNGISGGLVRHPTGQPGWYLTMGPDFALYCINIDPSSGSMRSCGQITFPTGLGHTNAVTPILKLLDNRVFGYAKNDMGAVMFFCHDFTHGLPHPCTGMPASGTAVSYTITVVNAFFAYDTSMNAVAFCTNDFSGGSSVCVSISTYVSGSVRPASDFYDVSFFSRQIGGPLLVGTKAYFGVLGSSIVKCWDWATGAPCGTLALPEADYCLMVNQDTEGCLWCISNNGKSFNFSPDLTMPCNVALPAVINNELYMFTDPIPCTASKTLDVLSNDLYIIPESLEFVGATSDSIVSATDSSPYTLQWRPSCPSFASWQGVAVVNYTVCSDSWDSSRVTGTAYVVADAGPAIISTLSFITTTVDPITKPWSQWITPGIFPIDPSSFAIVTPIPEGQGRATFDAVAQTVTFFPDEANTAPAMMTVSICDKPPVISPPIPPVCDETDVTWVPYYVHWITPDPRNVTVWELYVNQPIQCITNLPNDFQFHFSLLTHPAGTLVSSFSIPAQRASENMLVTSRWNPHRVGPAQYKLQVKTVGSSIAQLNNYVWPTSGIIQLVVHKG